MIKNKTSQNYFVKNDKSNGTIVSKNVENTFSEINEKDR